MFSPCADSLVGFTCTRTAGFCPPLILTSPTPLNWEIRGARRVSTRSSTCDKGKVSDVMASVSTGASAGLVLL